MTGGIGSGKSEVCRLLRNKGLPVLEADVIAKDLTSSLPAIRIALIDLFGDDIYLSEKVLNVSRMREIVFGDEAARQQVNNIIHPHVSRFIKDEATRLHREEKADMIGVEAALIYESGMDEWLDKVVVVTASKKNRIERLIKRDRIRASDITSRMAVQMYDNELLAKADYVVENNASLEQLRVCVDRLYAWLNSAGELYRVT